VIASASLILKRGSMNCPTRPGRTQLPPKRWLEVCLPGKQLPFVHFNSYVYVQALSQSQMVGFTVPLWVPLLSTRLNQLSWACTLLISVPLSWTTRWSSGELTSANPALPFHSAEINRPTTGLSCIWPSLMITVSLTGKRP